MKIQTRILLAFACSIAIGFFFVLHWIREDVKPHYRESAEETLVETAELLAPFAAAAFTEDGFIATDFQKSIQQSLSRRLDAHISHFHKTKLTARIYVTDINGRVVYDSDSGKAQGLDYSRWNDVARTLKGQYGARSTRIDQNDPSSTVMYVAAPVFKNRVLVGSLTVAKSNTATNELIETARFKVLLAALLAAAITVLFALAASFWIGRPIQMLTSYARSIKAGKRVPLPTIAAGEIRELGIAFEEMRDALEGKRYSETYVQSLTHEIKSPLSAIIGAVEILEDKNLPPEQRMHFLRNLRVEASRITTTVDRLLELSVLESKKVLQKSQPIKVGELLDRVKEQYESRAQGVAVTLTAETAGDIVVFGEVLLLEQALGNLVENALSFSPPGGSVVLRAKIEKQFAKIEVVDSGPGIPHYARDRVFERFYSLPRPNSNQRSTGLGLSFVKEVIDLHAGSVTLENRTDGHLGARACILLPLTPQG